MTWPRLKNKNPLAGAFVGKKALIIGTADCFYEDMKGVDYESYEVFGLNDIPVYYSIICDHLVSMHPERIGWYTCLGSKYQIHARPDPNGIKLVHDRFQTHSNEKYALVDHVWTFNDGGGSTSLYAVKICMIMGFDKIHLVGCPMDNSPRFTMPRGMKSKHDYSKVENWETWENHAKDMEGRVFSRSGKTRELLGGF